MYLLGKAKQRESESGGRSRQRRRQRSQAVDSSDGMLEEAGREYAEAEEVVVRLERRRVWIPDRLRKRLHSARAALQSARARAFDPEKQCESLPEDVYDRFKVRQILAATPGGARVAVEGELRRGRDTRERLGCASIDFARRCREESETMRERMHCFDEEGKQRTPEEAEAERAHAATRRKTGRVAAAKEDPRSTVDGQRRKAQRPQHHGPAQRQRRPLPGQRRVRQGHRLLPEKLAVRVRRERGGVLRRHAGGHRSPERAGPGRVGGAGAPDRHQARGGWLAAGQGPGSAGAGSFRGHGGGGSRTKDPRGHRGDGLSGWPGVRDHGHGETERHLAGRLPARQRRHGLGSGYRIERDHEVQLLRAIVRMVGAGVVHNDLHTGSGSGRMDGS